MDSIIIMEDIINRDRQGYGYRAGRGGYYELISIRIYILN